MPLLVLLHLHIYVSITKKGTYYQRYGEHTNGIPVAQSRINSTIARGEVPNPDDTDLRLSGGKRT